MSTVKFISCFLFVCSLCQVVPAQYAIGFRGGMEGFILPLESTSKRVEPGGGTVVGLMVQQANDEGPGYRFSLDVLKRSFHLDQHNDQTNRREVLDVDQRILQLSSEVRFKLSATQKVYFDFGPSIGARMSERLYGIAFYDQFSWRSTDTVRVMGSSNEPFSITDIHLRMGLSADLSLANRVGLTTMLSVSPGWSDGFRSEGYLTARFQALMGITYALFTRPQVTPDGEETHFFPMNSRLTELMQ
ncbi:MAG: hypothetical protein JNM62_02415 [Flavobacteriales bacterium]|nr:hypothetical protein [Flavobacteriales bacterium]